MCTVNIKVDDAVMRRINPDLTTHESISQWLQQKVDDMIEAFANNTSVPPCTYSDEEMKAILNQRMEDLLADRAVTIPHEKVIKLIDEKYKL